MCQLASSGKISTGCECACGQIFLIKKTLAKKWATYAVPWGLPGAHPCIVHDCLVDRNGKQWVYISTSTTTLAGHASWYFPLGPNNNSQMPANERHDEYFSFENGEEALFEKGSESYFRLDNAFLTPRDLLTPMKSEKFPRVVLPPVQFKRLQKFIKDYNVIKESHNNPLWTFEKSQRKYAKRVFPKQTYFYHPPTPTKNAWHKQAGPLVKQPPKVINGGKVAENGENSKAKASQKKCATTAAKAKDNAPENVNGVAVQNDVAVEVAPIETAMMKLATTSEPKPQEKPTYAQILAKKML